MCLRMSPKDFARMGNRVVSGEWHAQQLKLPKELESRKGPSHRKIAGIRRVIV